MVIINGLPPTRITNSKKTDKKPSVNQEGRDGGSQTSKVAQAVSQSIRPAKESDIEKARLQYDLPEGHSRKAMEAYINMLNQSKKEELAQLAGVDLYI